MTAELAGASALGLSGAALLLGQRQSGSRALGGLLAALLLLSAASLGADFVATLPDAVRDWVTPAFARVAAAAVLLAVLALAVPQIIARMDRMWMFWSFLAISEASSLAFRSQALVLEEFWSSGVAAIVALALILITALRLRRRPRLAEPV